MGHPGEIALENGNVLTDASAEVARIWVIRHAARAYAQTWDGDEAAMLQAIVDGLTEELREQFGSVETIQEGKLN